MVDEEAVYADTGGYSQSIPGFTYYYFEDHHDPEKLKTQTRIRINKISTYEAIEELRDALETAEEEQDTHIISFFEDELDLLSEPESGEPIEEEPEEEIIAEEIDVEEEPGEFIEEGPPSDASCSADHDFITLVEWTDEKPGIYINVKNSDPTKPSILNCYNAQALRTWVRDPANTFAEWVAKPGQTLDNVGHGGAPDLKKKYVKLYGATSIFVREDASVQNIKDGISNVFFNAVPWDVKRMGNLQGTFGVSQDHGQYPGYQTYQLEITDLLEAEFKEPPTITEQWFLGDDGISFNLYTDDPLLKDYESSWKSTECDESNVVCTVDTHKISKIEIEGNLDEEIDNVKLKVEDINGFSFFLTGPPNWQNSYEMAGMLANFLSKDEAYRYIIEHLEGQLGECIWNET